MIGCGNKEEFMKLYDEHSVTIPLLPVSIGAKPKQIRYNKK